MDCIHKGNFMLKLKLKMFHCTLWKLLGGEKVCLATYWTTGRSRFDPRQRRKNFSSSLCVQTGSVPTQPPVQRVPGFFSPRIKRGRGVTLTTNPHLVSRSWMSRSYTSSSPCATISVLWACFVFITDMYTTETIERLQHPDRLVQANCISSQKSGQKWFTRLTNEFLGETLQSWQRG
jgi:hypothetical protein